MRNLRPHLAGLAALLAVASAATASRDALPPQPPADELVRELYVPMEDLNVLLQGGSRRVLLPRDEYEALLAKAKREEEARPPLAAAPVAAEYQIEVGRERARIRGAVEVNVLAPGLHAVPLSVGQVGLAEATLDGTSAPLGRGDDGRLHLFVEGKGRHRLELAAVAPLETTAARQVLRFELPTPAATRVRLTVPGDVEVKSGAAVLSRAFDEANGVTRIELLPTRGPTVLVMTLNSRLKRLDRVVVAQSVLVAEVRQAVQRLTATVSLDVLHRAVDAFRFVVPAGYEVTDVLSPQLARWAVTEEGGRRILEVQLREEATGTVVLTIGTVRHGRAVGPWAMPRLEPLDVVGHSAVVGLLLEDRLKAEALQRDGLIGIDTPMLLRALPAVPGAEVTGGPVRPVAAYYAPQADFTLTADIAKPPAELLVTSNLLLVLQDSGLELQGGLAMLPKEEKLFTFDIAVPAGWDVLSVSAEGGQALPFERYGPRGEDGRVHVRLPRGLAAGQETRIYFTAKRVPDDWFGAWETQTVAFPAFAVAGAARDTGAVAVDARDDLRVRPETLERLTPLDENEKSQYGLGGVATSLAYRYEGRPYEAELRVTRIEPRLTAETFNFFRVERDARVAHYELIYTVEQARARELRLVLPASTPTALAIRGLDGLGLKEYTSQETDGGRVWTAVLADARKGTLRLAVDFEQRLGEAEQETLGLPLVRAEGVQYQSGFVAVEGSPELDVRVTAHPRRVDVGELVDADYLPGRRLLGAYGFVGEPPAVTLAVSRHETYPVPPALVERAELATVLSASGVAQSAARFLLRTKALYLEVRLPAGATLWSATLDGRPAKPQQEGERILLSLPAGAPGAVRDLQVVYEMLADRLLLWDRLGVPSPRLVLHETAADNGRQVPVTDLVWTLQTPAEHRVVAAEGSVVAEGIEPPAPAGTRVAEWLLAASGGVDFDHGLLALLLQPLSCAVQSGRALKSTEYADAPAWDDTGAMPSELPTDEEVLEAEMPPPVSQAQAGDVAGEAAATEGTEQAVRRPEEPTAREVSKWALAGARSLNIALTRTDEAGGVVFRSLGEEPALNVTIVSRRRVEALAWGLAVAVFVLGLALTPRSAGRKAAYVVVVLLAATALPAVPGWLELALVTNPAFYAACLLVPYYLAAALVRGFLRGVGLGPKPAAAAAAAALVAAGVLVAGAGVAEATEPAPDRPYVVQIVPLPDPVDVPDDAILVPYDPAAGPARAGRLLIPYDRYRALWEQAYPDERREGDPPPAAYALAGAAYTARLAGEEYLLVEGGLDLDVYEDGLIAVPLPLGGGVLARADLDGRPARLGVGGMPVPVPNAPPGWVEPASVNLKQPVRQAPVQQAEQQARPGAALLVLYVEGKGRHRLDLAVRMKLERRGGWRVAEGTLPHAPATALTLTVPEAETELRLGGVADRRTYETKQPGETIRTALGPGGGVTVRWRPKVSEGHVDYSLTAESAALLDVQEDRVRLTWDLTLQFRRTEREFFTIALPAGYLVEEVAGTNVRGWEIREGAGGRRLEVSLLKAARDGESLRLTLWRPGRVAAAGPETLAVPVVGVEGAVRHSGRLTVRRSPLLDVRTVAARGVTRTDVQADALPRTGADDSPLGTRPYQAYAFASVPFTIELGVQPVDARVWAEVQSILRVADRERLLETRVLYHVQDRPIYRARLAIPDDLEIREVTVPGSFEWAVTREAGRRVLTVYFGSGVLGDVPVVVRGKLGQDGPVEAVPLPRLAALDVDRQEADLVVQVDPAFDVRARDLDGVEVVLLKRVQGWLSGGQRQLARLAFHMREPVYGGRLELSPRQPDVSGYTVSNVRVTSRALEETILLVFDIRRAGVRQVVFRLPAYMADARISVPLLRQKTVEPVEGTDQVRVTLDLQDEVMDELRVLVERDRLLTPQVHEAPVPVVETGRTDRRYVALESAGRDEVVVEATEGLEPLSRQQKEWRTVAGLLQGGLMQVYLVRADAEPHLAFRTKQRTAVETAGARIGLARTVLMMDASGAYRGVQTYQVDNSTEQVLAVRLPATARLWTARVAGALVKPAEAEGGDASLVRIPLVKTAAGDLDYPVVLKYGGKRPPPGEAGRVAFPLIRTENINVELSQVELRLPRTHRWVHFDGTLGRVTREGEFEAGVLAYQGKVLKRLVSTLQYDNAFAKGRAFTNLRQFQKGLKQTQTYYADLADQEGNERLQEEVRNAASLLREADRQLGLQTTETGELRLGDEGQVSIDNRERLNDAYVGQTNKLARNQVQDVGANWSGALNEADGKAQWRFVNPNNFNSGWFDANGLVVQATRDEAVSGKAADLDKSRVLSEFQMLDQRTKQLKAPAIPMQKGGKGKADADGDRRDERYREARRRGGQAEAAQRYVRKLEEQQQQLQVISEAEEALQRLNVTGGDPTTINDIVTQHEDGLQAGRGITVSLGGGAGQAVDFSGGPIAAFEHGRTHALVRQGGEGRTGLVSLDVDLPAFDASRWQRVRFTTPRGDVRLDGWAASRSMVEGLERLGVVVASVAVVLLVRAVARRARTRALHGLLSTALIVLGALGVLFGVLPVAGLLALLAGIVWKIARVVGRRIGGAEVSGTGY